MNCKMCGSEKKLVKAHAIPAAFFPKNGNDSEVTSFLHTFDSGIHPQRSPAGVYDKELLCLECEQRFQQWDDYGTKLLLRGFSDFRPVVINGVHAGWRLDHYDFHLMKMFIVGMLWRAAASTHRYFAGAQLGPFELLARQAILDDDPGSSDFFATVLARWHSPSIPTRDQRVDTSPYRDRIEGVNALRIYFGEFVAYVKVDKRRFPGAFGFFQLHEETPLVVVARDLDSSDELLKTAEWLASR